jgi:hypothetical protein
MMYMISIEGQNFPVPETIGATDKAVKDALVTAFPEVTDALITRVEKDGVTTITVVKKAKSKGADPLTALVSCPGGRNPAITLYEEIRELQLSGYAGAYELLALEERVTQAVKDGQQQADLMTRSLKRLKAARPQPAPGLIEGF